MKGLILVLAALGITHTSFAQDTICLLYTSDAADEL